MGECFSHGHYDGWSCGICDLNKATNQAADEVAAATAAAAERVAYEQELTRLAVEQSALDHRQVAAEAAEEQRRLARDGWKLEAGSRVAQAVKLLRAGLVDEAGALAEQAVRQDPGNWYAHAILGAVLSGSARTQDAQSSFLKSLRLVPSDTRKLSVLLSWLPPEHELGVAVTDAMTQHLRNLEQVVDVAGHADERLGLIQSAVQRNWLDEALALARSLDPPIEDDVIHAFWTLAPAVAAVLTDRIAAQDFARAVIWKVELDHRRGQPCDAHPLLSDWNSDHGRAMIRLLAERLPQEGLISPQVVESVRSHARLFLAKDKPVRDREIEEQAQSAGRLPAAGPAMLGLGCVLAGCLTWGVVALSVSFVGALIKSLSSGAGDMVIQLGAVGAVVAPFVGGPIAVWLFRRIRSRNAVAARKKQLEDQENAIASAAGVL